MRALVCRRSCDWNELEVLDIAPPAMVPGGVRIAVDSASVSFAMSLQVAGKYQRTYPMPFTPGTEVAGVVREVAPGVTQVRPGDRVLAIVDWGGLAEQVVVRAATVYPLPPGLEFNPAIHLPNAYGTAYGALLWRGQAVRGETVLVTGAAGAVGTASVEIARHLGTTVIAAASSAAKRDFCAAHGAHPTVAYDTLRDEVMRASGGRGVDVAIDMVGGDAFDAIIRTLRPFGRLVSVGFASGNIPSVPANLLLVKNIGVLGHNMGLYYGWGPADGRESFEPRMRAMMADLFEWTRIGALTPTVSHVFRLDDYREAMRVIREREATGKVIIRIGTDHD